MPRKYNLQKKLHVKKGDLVEVISGNDKGKRGRVLTVYPARERVLVEGVNVRIKHQKPNQNYPKGGRIEKEMSVHASNVLPIDPIKNKPTRIGRQLIEVNGLTKWVRVAKMSGEVLDK
jgi:large subunit ribosomal protein L24